MRQERHDILFEPVRIGCKTLRNRFYQVPHCTGFGVEKPFTQAAHRGLKAEGGWGAVCTEYCSISQTSDDSPYVSARLWDDDDVAALRLMTEEAHRHGALAGVELWHGGVHAEARESRLPALAPSQIAWEVEGHHVPQAMTSADIRRTHDEWVAAALRARDAGFDIVYVYGAHTYLTTQFLSPRFNRRTDAYGGSFENRARFWLEAIERVRGAIGDDCAIAVRIAADGLATAGVEADEGAAFVRAADPMIDLWDVTAGALAGYERVDAGPSRFFAQGSPRPATAWIRAATAKPLVGVGRYTDPDVMAEEVRSGAIDLIGAARPSIADPFLPRKIEEGRYDEIRECIGCNSCYSRANYGRHLGCTQNATAGEEHRRGWHPERFATATNADRDVLVVGAGPAGLEAAIVLAKRGFKRVHVVEAEREIGGLLRWVPRLPGLGDWGRVLDWRSVQLKRLRRQIELVTGERLTADAVRGYGAELVVVATGSRWSTDGLNGFTQRPLPGADASLPQIATPEQLMLEGKVLAGDTIAVIDCDGYFVAASVAERLASEGRRVRIVTPYAEVAPHTYQTLEAPRLHARLRELGVGAACGATPIALEPGGVAVVDVSGERSLVAADAVVLVTQRVSEDALYHELIGDPAASAREGVEGVYRAGDCVAPRILADAIFDGHRLAREIDSPDPAVPLPWLRERAAL